MSEQHWETIYKDKRPTEVSWYRPHLDASLKMLEKAGLTPDTRVIDVGGGASTLVDDLLDKGLRHVTVLDISSGALEIAKARLGRRADSVEWIAADMTRAELPAAHYDVWHDRAALHFLIGAEDRSRYVDALRRALKPGGQAIIAAFSLEGPPRCSGLDVVRYSSRTLAAELGKDFDLVEEARDEHRTPSGAVQKFVYCRFRGGIIQKRR